MHRARPLSGNKISPVDGAAWNREAEGSNPSSPTISPSVLIADKRRGGTSGIGTVRLCSLIWGIRDREFKSPMPDHHVRNMLYTGW